MGTILLENANLIPLTANRIDYNQDVFIEDGNIKKISLHSGTKPVNNKVIDCTGKFIIPSLTDCHVHIISDDNLEWYLCYGVTCVQNMQGLPLHLKWKNEVMSGERVGCDIYTAGPIIDGHERYMRISSLYKKDNSLSADRLYPDIQHYPGLIVATDKKAASDAVDYIKAAGYDSIKVYSNISRDVYETICDRAAEISIAIIGHLPECLNSDYSSETFKYQYNQKTIEHLSVVNEEIIRKMLESGIYLGTTIIVDKIHIENGISSNDYQSQIKKMNPAIIDQWQRSKKVHMDSYYEDKNRRITVRRSPEYYAKMLRFFVENGGKILAGTDGGLEYLVPGYTLHKELEYLVEYGLSAYEALKAATVNPAAYLGIQKEAGTIEIGKKARLLVLDANPMEEISNTQKISMIIKDQAVISSIAAEEIKLKSRNKAAGALCMI